MVSKLRDRIAAGPAGGERPLTPEEMDALARAVDLESLDLKEYAGFKEECYARNTVFLNEHVELVVICWLPGQASSVHDHGNSYCLYLVVDGEMAEERYRLGEDGKPVPTDERAFRRGEITISDGAAIHRIANRGSDKLVTVHIYSPPLDEAMTLFTPIPRKSAG